jgi:hypothetical protein
VIFILDNNKCPGNGNYELIENEKEKEMNKRMLLKLGYFIANDDTQRTPSLLKNMRYLKPNHI